MKTVELQYKKAHAPERLSELTESQLIMLAKAFTYGKKIVDAKVLLASNILKPVWQLNEKLIKATLHEFKSASVTQRELLYEKLENMRHNRAHMAACFDWITTEQICDKWLIPSLTLRNWFWVKQFKGPQLRMANIQFWQWCQAEFYFFKFNKTGQRHFFNKFCACLYMPHIAGRTATFDDKLIEKNAHWFSKLTPVQLTAIKLNYIALKSWIALNHPHVFGRTETSDIKEIETIDMGELLLRAAKAQNMDETIVAKKPLLVELKKLEIAGKDFAEQKRKLEDNK